MDKRGMERNAAVIIVVVLVLVVIGLVLLSSGVINLAPRGGERVNVNEERVGTSDEAVFLPNLLVFPAQKNDPTGAFAHDEEIALIKADELCNTAAKDNGYPGEYRAWLSNGNVDAKDRIVDGVYKNRYGGTIASSKIDLTTNTVEAAIEPLYYLMGLDDEAWTGTSSDGTESGFPAYGSCNGWTSASGYDDGRRGDLNKISASWTSGSIGRCDGFGAGEPRNIYCFQATPGDGPVCGNGYNQEGEDCDDGNKVNGDGCSSLCQFEQECGDGMCSVAFGEDAISCPSDCGKEGEYLVFISHTNVEGSFGWGVDDVLEVADEFCMDSAEFYGYKGNFVAYLGGGGIDPIHRLADGKFYNIYGLDLADSKADLFDGTLANPIDSLIVGPIDATRGAPYTGAHADGTTALTCDGWTDGGDEWELGTAGSSTSTDYVWSEQGEPAIPWGENCIADRPFYCFQVESDPEIV